MGKLLLLSFALPGLLMAQVANVNRAWEMSVPVEPSLFKSCDGLSEIARGYAERLTSPVGIVHLFPINNSPHLPFPSDTTINQSLIWLNSPATDIPVAVLYSFGDRYTFKCKTGTGQIVVTSEPNGDDPLHLQSGGNARILHFNLNSDGYNANVYVVADGPLTEALGVALLDEVTQRMGVRVLALYVRNDPWFYDFAPDSTMYHFVDVSKRLSDEEFRRTHTMVCYSYSKRCR
jgi:hypothetical protein